MSNIYIKQRHYHIRTLIIQLLDHLHYYSMIFITFQPTHDHHCNHSLHAGHSNRNPPTMNSILPCTIPQPIFISKADFIAIKLAMHIPRTAPPPQHRLPLPRNPAIIIRHHSRVCACMKEGLVLVRERDVDYHRCRYREETIPQRRTKFPRIVRCEMFED